MKITEQQTIQAMVNDSLDQAECVWNQVKQEVCEAQAKNSVLMANSARAIHSLIPGHKFIEDGKPLVDEFIAMVMDMRGSTHHLNCAIAGTKASQLQRIFYET